MKQQETKEKLRLDKYLWSIRLYKTRSLASEACEKGKVKYNGLSAKPSKNVQLQDEYEVKTEVKKIRIKVTGLLHSRVQYSEAIENYMDVTPEEDQQVLVKQTAAFHTGKRLSKTGKPTKKQKRDLDQYIGFNDN